MKSKYSRRDFLVTLSQVGIAAGFASVTGCASSTTQTNPLTHLPSRKLNVAFIGTGGMGGNHVDTLAKLGVECPCYCDVDSSHWARAAKHWPKARGYQDYWEMFDRQEKDFDAVMIGIPDHSHFPATVLAMKAGKSVYTQKPLTHTVWEARQLTQMAKQYNVATQMGNQGHAGQGWRITHSWIKSGAIGQIKEVHTWTNRPIWPQGLNRPEGTDPVPSNLAWNDWIGVAPMRPYKHGVYHDFKWRGWLDFGAGALGDMACHTMDSMFAILDPGYPTAVEPITINGLTSECFPKSSALKWEFSANHERPGFTAYWYDGGLKPNHPKDLEPNRSLSPTGNLYIGTEGTIMVSGDYGESPVVIPEVKRKSLKRPPMMLNRSIGHYEEWVEAAKGNQPRDFCKSNFSYAGPMTETILLGNIALRVGQRIEWDGPNMQITNFPEANQYLSKIYREGWVF